MKKKILYSLYIAAFTGVCLIPGLLTPFTQDSDESAEKRELAEFPSIKTEDGRINTDWTKEFDTYFSEHFAFRNDFVNLNSTLMSEIFRTSAEDDVIIGRDGWLYYSYTADDFTGVSPAENWEIEETAHIIQMMEKYAQSKGTRMIFACVPNKNSVYPEYMPYNYLKSSMPSDLDRLESQMTETGVDFISLKRVLSEKKEEEPEMLLYHKTDTHWNNYGAFTAYNAVAEKLSTDIISAGEPELKENAWEGDLQQMLFPQSDSLDEQYEYDLDTTYSYVGRFRALDDILINTVCPEKDNSLLMFRDSFGEAILPFMAESFGTAQFSRTVPYSLDQLESGGTDYCILEIVERNLGNLRKTAPNMPAQPVEGISCDNIAENIAQCYSTPGGTYTKLYGKLDNSAVSDKSCRIYAVVDGITYEAFPVYEEELLGGTADGNHGFALNIQTENIETAEIIIETDDGVISSGNISVKKNME
ncbi:MAG: hypothetical protein ACI4JB_01405 [Porcipelethomonas sp.]